MREKGDLSQMLSLIRDVCCHGILRVQHFLTWWTVGLGAQRGHGA